MGEISARSHASHAYYQHKLLGVRRPLYVVTLRQRALRASREQISEGGATTPPDEEVLFDQRPLFEHRVGVEALDFVASSRSLMLGGLKWSPRAATVRGRHKCTVDNCPAVCGRDEIKCRKSAKRPGLTHRLPVRAGIGSSINSAAIATSVPCALRGKREDPASAR